MCIFINYVIYIKTILDSIIWIILNIKINVYTLLVFYFLNLIVFTNLKNKINLKILKINFIIINIIILIICILNLKSIIYSNYTIFIKINLNNNN